MFNALAHGLRGRSNPQDYLLSRFGGASAAYSLRRLTSGVDNVVRARESVGDTEADFTAGEVSGGALREFALQNDADLIRFADQAVAADERMYFDGSNDSINVGNVPAEGRISCKFIMTAAQTQYCCVLSRRNTAGVDTVAIAFDDSSGLKINGTVNNSGVFGTSSTLEVGREYEVALAWSGGSCELFLDGASLGADTYTGSFTPNFLYVGRRTSYFKGLIYDVGIYSDTAGNTPVHTYNGYGNTAGDWEDQTGSSDGTVNGSPALFSGQGFDAYVTTLYDQSESLGQPLSRFANRASASDARMQFDGSDDGINTGHTFTEMATSGDFYVEFDMMVSALPSTYAGLVSNRVGTSEGLFIYIASTGKIRSHIRDTSGIQSFDTTKVFNVGTIYRVRVVGDAGTMSLYYSDDGGETFTLDPTNRAYDETNVVTMSQNIYLGDCPVEATLEGLLYNVTLSDAADNSNIISSYNGYGITDADWEDQVGSNDGTVNGSPAPYQGRNAIQATAASQPQIVADGVVVTDKGGNPSCDYDGTDDFLDIAFAPGAITSCLWLAVANKDVSADNTYVIDFRDADNDGIRMFCEATPRLFGSVGAADPLQAHDTNLDVLTVEYDGVNGTAYVNGAGGTPVASSAQNVAGNGGIGYAPYLGTSHFDGDITEVILYFTDKSSDRAAIEANIAASYGITLA